MFDPTLPELVIVRSRLSPAAWNARVAAAFEARKTFEKIQGLVDGGGSLNAAIAATLPESKRSWGIRRWPRYLSHGVEGLFDFRLPREQRLGQVVREVVERSEVEREPGKGLQLGNVVSALQREGVAPLPSPSTIKREIARARDRVRQRPPAEEESEKVVELALAGGELLLAAEVESQAIGSLTDEVMRIANEAREASEGREPARDRADRDWHGRFTARYNRKRRRNEGQKIASYLRPAAEKAEGRVPSWPRFVDEGRETIEAKLRTLVFEPLINRTKGWEGLRSPEASGLGPLTGYAYMPSTLAKFTSALAIANAGPRLLDVAGKLWHGVATERWREAGAMAALYIDNHAKEVWTSLFSQAAKVSRLNRVMPAITVTYAHTGVGTPLVLGVQSGAAPLAPKLSKLVERAEELLGDEIRRAVVIDSEGSTFDILKTFADSNRVIITPLRPSRAPDLELHYSRGSYYRHYRENDELRIAQGTLTHKSTKRSLNVGVLLIARDNKESDSVLLTTGLALGMEGRDLADLYFERWPLQENWFKAAGAVSLDEHRGNCSRMVANVAVVSELERVKSRSKSRAEELTKLRAEVQALEIEAGAALLEEDRAEKRLKVRRGRLDVLVAGGRQHTKPFVRAAADHHEALASAEAARAAFGRALAPLEAKQHRLEKLQGEQAQAEARMTKLNSANEIRQIDVALDSILTATKITAAQLMSFAIREYLPSPAVTPQTFVARILTTRGRRIERRHEELIIFEANQRDPEVAEMLRGACDKLNARGLSRGGRHLRYVVENSAHDSHQTLG